MNQVNRAGDAALHMASVGGHAEVVRVLLTPHQAGQGIAAIHQRDHNRLTAMQLAIRQHHAATAGILLAKGAFAVTMRDHRARHLLEVVARNGHADTVAEALITLFRV